MNPSAARERAANLLVPVLFFASGVTGLGVQVALSRLLTYVFGVSHLATATVLAAYMAGLTAGAFLAGRLSTRIQRPLRAYGLMELAVGLVMALLPTLFEYFQAAGVSLARPYAEHPLPLTLIRFAWSAVLVFLPTLLMGGTLPVLVSAFRGSAAVRERLPVLYAVNTLGAAAGALVSGYALLPALGIDGTLYLCACINAVIAACAMGLSRQDSAAPAEAGGSTQPAEQHTEENDGARGIHPRTACLLAFGQGVVAFGLEVVWFHLLGTVIGVTTYAFSIMLTAILLGIGLGSLWTRRLLRGRPGAEVYASAQLGMALALAVSLWLWDRFPDVVAWSLELRKSWSFAGREAVRFAYALLLVFPASLAMGVALPALAAAGRGESASGGGAGRWVGALFGVNTLGTIAGALACGFLLLGRVPSETLLALGAAAAAGLGALAVVSMREDAGLARFRRRLACVGAAVLGLVLFFPGWNIARLTSGSHYYWVKTPDDARELLFVREDAQSGYITVDGLPSGERVLKTNGKYEGTNAGDFQSLFALIGGLYLRRFEDAVLVGHGPGLTLATLHAFPFKRLEIVEYSPAILDAAARHYPEYNGGVLDDAARVRVVVNDGRNHLQFSARACDLAVIGISGAAFAGVGSLYSRECFELVRGRLAPGGVFVLWIQLHHVFDHDVRSVVYTLRQIFPHIHFYTDQASLQGMLVASMDPLRIDPNRMRELGGSPRLQRHLRAHGMSSLLQLTALNIFTSDEELQAYFKSPAIARPPALYTDFWPAFEYSTPYGLATGIGGYNFQPLSRRALPVFEPALAPADLHGLQGLRHLAARDPERAAESFEAARQHGATQWNEWLEQLKRKP